MKRTVYRSFDYAECDDFAAFLNSMAMQGWHFKEWGLGLVFEKGAPQEMEYAVEVISKSRKDREKTSNKLLQEEREFADYCNTSGWLLLAQKDGIYIFKKLKEDAVPVLTAEERLGHIFKEVRKQRVTGTFTFVLLFLLRMYCFWNNPEAWLFQGAMFLIPVIILIECLFDVLCLLSIFIWKMDKHKKVEKGEDIYFGKKENRFIVSDKIQFSVRMVCEIAIAMIFLYYRQYEAAVIIPLMFGIGEGGRILEAVLEKKLKWKKDDKRYDGYRAVNMALMFVFVQILDIFMISPMAMQEEIKLMKEECPLIQEDYMEVEGEFEEAVYCEVNSGAGAIKRYDITYQNLKSSVYPADKADTISYVIYESENDWVLDRVYNYLKGNLYGEMQEHTEKWGAQEAVSGENYLYIVKYEDKVVRFGDYANLTQDQIDIIREELDLR